MNPDEGKWAETTIRRHYSMRAAGIDDGRNYFVSRTDTQITGIVGLHHYEWGPPQNVWLGWFAVQPSFQRKGIGTSLLSDVETEAVALGYKRLLIETYSSTEFHEARVFYSRRGYIPCGTISAYIQPEVDMIVYGKKISDDRPA